ncbi:MAG: hypothetical protein AAB550_02795 [Patescibacteria group bacterium]
MSEVQKGEDLGFPVRTPDVKNRDRPGEVISQTKAQLGHKSGDGFIKRDAYKRLDSALRKVGKGDSLNEITKKALGEK